MTRLIAGLAPPRGDADRTAVDALRGYAFQIYGSVLAWTMLAEDAVLYLELAEDFATATTDTLHATQAKDTQGSGGVTLNTPGVRQAIATLVDLTARNPDRTVRLRYLSTSPIGVEANPGDRIEGLAGLDYWRRVAAGDAEAGPLLRRLRAMTLPPQVARFVTGRGDDDLRRDLVDRIDWDCGRGGTESLHLEIEARLTRFGGVHGQRVGIDDADRVIASLVRRTLATATKPDGRSLTALDLRRAIHEATHVAIPRAQLSNLLDLLEDAGHRRSVVFAAPASPHGLERVDGLAFPRLLLERPGLVETIGAAMVEDGVSLILGGAGVGKTLVARLAARRSGGTWHALDLPVGDGPGTVDMLRGVLGRVDDVDTPGLLVDDFDAADDPAARRALIALVSAMRRVGRRCLITTTRDPPRELLEALRLDRDRVVRVTRLDEEEVNDLVVQAGGRREWGRLAWLASDGGHPRLAQAVVADLADRGWSPEALAGHSHDAPGEFRRERTGARRRVQATVRDRDDRVLLYRASLVLGRFDRATFLALGAVEPRTRQPGETLDRLVGPWIDEVGPGAFKVSPLIGDAGMNVLDVDEQRRTHAAIAMTIMAGGSINVAQADALLHHGLNGKVEVALYAISSGLIWAEGEQRRLLAEWSNLLRNMPTGTPLCAEMPIVSTMLRVAQFQALVAVGRDDDLRGCVDALLRELQGARDAGGAPLEALVLAQILTEWRTGGMLEDAWPDLVVRLARILEQRPEGAVAMVGGVGVTLLGLACSVHAHAVADVAALGASFDRIGGMDPDARTVLLAAVSQAVGGWELVLSRPVIEGRERGALAWREASDVYSRMARQAADWGARELALRCRTTCAMLADEFGRAPDEALRSLDEAERDLGADTILMRARGRVLGRSGDHDCALPLLQACMDDPRDGDVERAFLARDVAVAAGHLGRHESSREAFERGRRHTVAVGDVTSCLAVGLAADAAIQDVMLGRGREALLRLSGCLDELEAIDPCRDVKSAHVHQLVRYAVLWAFCELTGAVVPPPEGPIRMLPGMCSIPEPTTDFRDTRRPPLSVCRYMLATVDVERDLGAGVDESLEAKLGGRILPRQEVILSQARMSRAIRLCDVAGYREVLPRWVDAQVFRLGGSWMTEADEWREVAVAHVDGRDWGRPDARTLVLGSVLAFVLVAASTGRWTALDGLHAGLDRVIADAGLRREAATMTGRRSPAERPPTGIADALGLIRQDGPRDPAQSLAVSVRLVEAATEIVGVGLIDTVGPFVAGWIKTEWSDMATRRRFALLAPSVTAPAIVEAVNLSGRDLPSATRIILAALPAVSLRLDADILIRLRTWAGRP